MPLTLRSNGSSGANIITSQWFNDFYNLLTGSMQDQEVTVKNNLALQAIGANPTTAPSGTAVSGSGLSIGAYSYAYTFVSPDGETTASSKGNVTTTTGNQKVNVSGILTGPTGTTARRLYRTAVGAGQLQLLTTINDNSTTTFTDTTPDGSLGANNPTNSTFGGSLVLKDASATTRLVLSNDGLIIPSGNATTTNGSVSGTVTFSTPVWGPAFKLAMVTFGNYNSASSALFTFPSSIGRGIYIMGDMGGTAVAAHAWQSSGSTVNSTVITGLAAGGGSGTNQNFFRQNTIGTIVVTIGAILIGSTTTAVNSALLLAGI